MVDAVLVSPAIAGSASALSVSPRLSIVGGQLVVEEAGTDAARGTLRQPVSLMAAVPALGLALVQAGEELYLLPLAGLEIS